MRHVYETLEVPMLSKFISFRKGIINIFIVNIQKQTVST